MFRIMRSPRRALYSHRALLEEQTVVGRAEDQKAQQDVSTARLPGSGGLQRQTKKRSENMNALRHSQGVLQATAMLIMAK